MACISVARLFLCICASRGVTPPTRGRAAAGAGRGGGQLFTVIQCYVHCCDPTCTALISVQVLTESIMCTLCTLLPKSIMCIVHTAKSIICIDFCSVFLERLESNCGFLSYHQSDLSQHCPCESYWSLNTVCPVLCCTVMFGCGH